MIVSHSPAFVFYAVPKTGTTSIERALRRSLDQLAPGTGPPAYQVLTGHEKHTPARDFLARDPFGGRPHFSFGFVRNPFDRFVSMYHQLQRPNLLEDPGRRRLHELAQRPFRDFVEGMLADGPIEQTNAHYLCDEKGRILVDFVGRYERLGEDMAEVAEILGFPDFRLPHLNVSRRSRYSEYYDDALVAKLRPSFRQDCELFGYDIAGPAPLGIYDRLKRTRLARISSRLVARIFFD